MKGIFLMGPSGVGKTTLASKLAQQYSQLFGGQALITINLDCANPKVETDINVCDLITLEDIMEQYELGPNGAILYASDFVLANLDWLEREIQAKAIQKNPAFSLLASGKEEAMEGECSMTLILDLPGQMQLYLQSESTLAIVNGLVKRFKLNSCLLQLFDATYIYEINDFVSMCMIALTTGINFQMPQINIINKIDLLKNRQPGHGMLEEYFKVTSLREMGRDLRMGQAPVLQKMQEVIDQYGRVSFAPCSIMMPDLIHFLIFHLQKIFGTLESNLYANKGFAGVMKSFLRDFVNERMINDLEIQLFGEEETDWEAEIAQIKAMTEKKPK